MHHRALMDAVEFLRVHLIGVDHRGLRQRQTLAAAPDRRLGGAAGGACAVEHLGAPWRLRAGDADGKRVGDENLRCRARRFRHAVGGDPRQMRDDPVDDRVLGTQSIAACTRFATRSSRAECHGSGDMKLVT